MSEELLLQEFPPHDLDKLCYEPPSPSNDGSSQDYLLFFISGNPGLISFYEPFLSELHSLRSSSTSPRFHICGHSFRGFELSPQNQSSGGPFSLEDQINFQNDLLYEHIKEHTRTVGKPPKVILMGHSVGAYVLLELIRRHKEFIDQNEDQDDVDLIGAILIFPTVQDIAKSPLGRVARFILPLPGFSVIMGGIAKALGAVVPQNALKSFIKWITNFPDFAASTTVSFMKSRIGVRQALYLAKDEMETITTWKWTNEVWGAATSRGTNSRDTINWNNVMYWGKDDLWVANKTRDGMIEAHSQLSPRMPSRGPLDERRPRMEIDKKGMPHDFCTTTRNSHTMAKLVNGWIDDLILAHNRTLTW